MTFRTTLAIVFGFLFATPSDAAPDLHRYWDTNCAECHGHSADFTRRFLSVKDGKLVGRHHVDDLRRFMDQHYLPADSVEPIYQMLLAQAQTAPLFQQQCASCHGTAADLARASLLSRDGIVYGRKSGRPVAEYLTSHAGLEASDVPFFVSVLARVRREVGGD